MDTLLRTMCSCIDLVTTDTQLAAVACLSQPAAQGKTNGKVETQKAQHADCLLVRQRRRPRRRGRASYYDIDAQLVAIAALALEEHTRVDKAKKRVSDAWT